MQAKQLALLALWLAALAGAAFLTARYLRVASDLTAFLPDAASETETLLLEELRHGVASRLILIGIEGDGPEQLSVISRKLSKALRSQAPFRRVENGEFAAQSELTDLLLRYRYLLSPQITAQGFTTSALRSALEMRLNELASPTELVVKDWLARDPTHELLAVLLTWQPSRGPGYHDGVWYDAANARALLVAETAAPGFDVAAQTTAVASIESAFRGAAGASAAKLIMTGPGPFGVLLEKQTRTEATSFSLLAAGLMLAVLLWAYRSSRLVLLGALPLLSAGILGMLAVQLVYGGVHGITLAFGMTLIGVANDYPLHVFSHLQPEQTPPASVLRIWPTLRLSVLATSIAYLTLVLADFGGLAQLGLFTVVGLVTAAVCTRWLLLPLLAAPRLDPARGFAAAAQARLDRLPVTQVPALILLGLSLTVLVISRQPLWDDELSGLTPVPKPLQELDESLRHALGAPDLRYLAVLRAADAETALRRSELLIGVLEPLRADKLLGGYDLAARYLPSIVTQQARQQNLPTPGELQTALRQAQTGLPFQNDLFAPFLQEVQAARGLAPLTPAAIADTPLALRVTPLLYQHEAAWLALVTLQDVSAPAELAQALAAAGFDDLRLLDLKGESEQMVGRFRESALWRIAFAVAATLLVMFWGLPLARILPTVLPYSAAVLSVMAAFHLLGLRLNLFHLVSLMLVAGVAMDYALFLGAAEDDPAERARSLHAVALCLLSTLSVFGILGLSQIPVLRAIGSTVALGVALSFVLALLGARPMTTKPAA
ncbi:MAG: MMPL family transporter [Nevskiales bacterium]